MTDNALDEKALEAAFKGAGLTVNGSWLDHMCQNAIRAYLRASPSQVAPQPQAGGSVLDADIRAVGDVLMRHGLNAPEQVIYSAARAVLEASTQAANPAQVTDACWIWQGTLFDAGYGAFQENGKTLRAHRVIYELVRGAIPDGLVLDHLCRNRACVNPWHLEPVSLVNIMRGESFSAQNARKTHCQNGHEFTPENTRQYQNRRICIECSREETRKRMRIMRAKKRAK